MWWIPQLKPDSRVFFETEMCFKSCLERERKCKNLKHTPGELKPNSLFVPKEKVLVYIYLLHKSMFESLLIVFQEDHVDMLMFTG